MSNAHNSDFQIQDRRAKVKVLLAMAKSETEIACDLGVDQATISRDKKAINQESQRWVYNLAKGDLAYFYRQRMDSLEQAKRKAWEICENTKEESINTDKVKLLALKLIITADEAAIKLLAEGPAVLTMQNMEARLEEVEQEGAVGNQNVVVDQEQGR